MIPSLLEIEKLPELHKNNLKCGLELLAITFFLIEITEGILLTI